MDALLILGGLLLMVAGYIWVIVLAFGTGLLWGYGSLSAGGAGLYRRALAYGAQGRRAGRAGLHPAGGRPGAAGQSRRCAAGGDPQPALAETGGQAAGGTVHRAQRGVQRQFRAAERRVDWRRAEPAPGARFLRPARAADPPSGTAARGAAPGCAARGRRRVARSRAELAATGSGPAGRVVSCVAIPCTWTCGPRRRTAWRASST